MPSINIVSMAGSVNPAAVNLQGQFTSLGPDINTNFTFKITPGMLAIVWNTDASAHTVRLKASADVLGRIVNSEFSMPAGEYWVYGPLKNHGWAQVNGVFWVSADDALVQAVALVR